MESGKWSFTWEVKYKNCISRVHEFLVCMLAFSLGVRLHRVLLVYLKNWSVCWISRSCLVHFVFITGWSEILRLMLGRVFGLALQAFGSHRSMVLVVPGLEVSVSYQRLGIRAVGRDNTCAYWGQRRIKGQWRNLREIGSLFA